MVENLGFLVARVEKFVFNLISYQYNYTTQVGYKQTCCTGLPSSVDPCRDLKIHSFYLRVRVDEHVCHVVIQKETMISQM